MAIMMSAALLEAIRKAGSVSKLAALIGVTPQAISQWKKPPATRVLDISRVTGIAPRELRPDVYPPKRARRATPESDNTPPSPKPLQAAE